MTTDPIWIPVAPSTSIQAAHHITAVFAHDEEIALWRSAEGAPQAWENRCPHRGTRFTLGRVLKGRVSCAYHGWEFEADGGKCSFIPAHPDQPAPRHVGAATFRAVDAQGMVWVAQRGTSGDQPLPAPLPQEMDGRFCRTLSVRVDAIHAAQGLRASGLQERAACTWTGALSGHNVTLFLNQASSTLTMLHAWVASDLNDAELHPVLAALRSLRSRLEAA
ncbi:Rieske 2Fe-2S domain-containing protein [Hydrogenophaga sp. 2FB]|uniref:Rieske 2Fe-2S domain-containing protein n=1 Tax=Hydrogenophaga sp. 2FB TaxID=2502187 RepID=UPI0010F72E69|nr:Rieske 2Fe-2S domain-containing protein [Hydrogenophaga sp. 2FB]